MHQNKEKGDVLDSQTLFSASMKRKAKQLIQQRKPGTLLSLLNQLDEETRKEAYQWCRAQESLMLTRTSERAEAMKPIPSG